MTSTHSRRAALALLAAGGLSACTSLPSTNPLTGAEAAALRIGRVEAVTTAAAFESDGARAVRNTLARDLEAQLRAEFSDRIVPGPAWTLQAEIASLNLAASAAAATGRDQSRLVGTLRAIDPAGNLRASLPITVTSGEERESLLGQIAATAVIRQSRFYRDLLEGFAREGRTLLLGPDLPGERLIRRVSSG